METDNIAIGGAQAGGADKSASSNLEPTPEELSRIQALYDKGACRQAYDLAASLGPLNKWRGVDASILSGRILLNLGSTRIAYRQYIRAFHADPGQFRTQAYYLETFMALRGPSLAWQQFRRFSPAARDGFAAQGYDGWEYLLTVGARMCGLLRDFERAEDWLNIVQSQRADSPWFFVEKAGLAGMREQWDEALKLCRRALEIRPWYRPAVQQVGHFLHVLDRDAESLEFLREASQRVESVPVLNQLAVLQMDLQRWAEALETLQQIERLSPVLDKAHKNWIAGQKCKAACVSGDYSQVESCAGQLTDEYHKDLAARLQKEPAGFEDVDALQPGDCAAAPMAPAHGAGGFESGGEAARARPHFSDAPADAGNGTGARWKDAGGCRAFSRTGYGRLGGAHACQVLLCSRHARRPTSSRAGQGKNL